MNPGGIIATTPIIVGLSFGLKFVEACR